MTGTSHAGTADVPTSLETLRAAAADLENTENDHQDVAARYEAVHDALVAVLADSETPDTRHGRG